MRILIADDQPKVRFALRVLLERQSGLQVVGEAADIGDLLIQLSVTCPDLMLLGWELPGRSDIDLLPAIRRICPKLPIIALSGRLEARQIALSAGVDAFVSKSDPPERLLDAIECCSQDPHTDIPWLNAGPLMP
jgi:DNA-binding NarL/FixJ family response regulator